EARGQPPPSSSLGGLAARTQAAVLGLYDPARSQTIRNLARVRTWSDFTKEILAQVRALAALQGEGLRFLSGAVTSPTFAGQMKAILAKFPQARWHRWEPAAPHAERQAAVAAFGSPVETLYDFTKAKVVLSLGSDFLTQGQGSVRFARDFAKGRHPEPGKDGMSRFYAVESTPTATTTIADHRMILSPAELEAFALAVAGALGAAPAVGADPYGSVELQLLAHAMNQALGNFGATIRTVPALEADPIDHVASIGELGRDLAAGKVELLVVLGSNPVYDAPAELKFGDAIRKAKTRVHWGLHDDETGELCQWHVPGTHELESWGDALGHDGTASVIQPLIDPLYDGKAAVELLAVFLEKVDASAYDLVRETWQASGRLGDFEKGWRKALHDGVLLGETSAAAGGDISGGAPAAGAVGSAAQAIGARKPAPDALTLLFRPDLTIWDGRHASNGWLQELPKPIIKLVWDNALILAPRTAQALGVTTEDMAEIEVSGRKLPVAVWVQPGHADSCATLHLGYGRRKAGPVGSGHGFDAYALRSSGGLWTAPAVLRKAAGRFVFANTQNHHLIENSNDEFKVATEQTRIRKPVLSATAAEYAKNPHFVHEGKEEPEITSFPKEWKYDHAAWGMTIDLSTCTGCVACVTACQAENNVPVVGKDQVVRGREMHWIRIDRYFEGDLDDPKLHNQPVPCMQCEQAPCEVVCPVAATTHSQEGLNDMVYNRCVGTRYCSNNCPYKVRRFNFLRYSNHDVPVLKLLQNPDVTVRMRGVMEKCTYCVQRINEAKIDAEVARRKLRPGEIVTACQQACPTEAITFGDQNDPEWDVSRRKLEPRNYALLADLNTRPRTTYLAKITNPNPQLPAAERS